MRKTRFDLQETATRHITDAGDEPMFALGANGENDPSKPMRITVHGPGSKVFESAVKKRAAAGLRKKNLKQPEAQVDFALEAQIEFLADTTERFENMEELYDEGLAGRDAFVAVYSNRNLCFIRDQINALQGETAGFKPGPSKS